MKNEKKIADGFRHSNSMNYLIRFYPQMSTIFHLLTLFCLSETLEIHTMGNTIWCSLTLSKVSSNVKFQFSCGNDIVFCIDVDQQYSRVYLHKVDP